MGRPLNKRNFKSGAGNQLAIRAKIGSNAEGDGFIVKQVGETRYRATVGANTGVVILVNKDNGSLAANEATITFQDEDSNTKRVKKLLAHRAVFFDGETAGWSFDPAADGIWEAADVEDGYAEEEFTITIDTQPETAIVGSIGDPASFTIEASVEPAAQLSYDWQAEGEGWYSLVGQSGFSGADTDTLTIDETVSEMNELNIRCVVYVNDIEDGTISDTVQIVFD